MNKSEEILTGLPYKLRKTPDVDSIYLHLKKKRRLVTALLIISAAVFFLIIILHFIYGKVPCYIYLILLSYIINIVIFFHLYKKYNYSKEEIEEIIRDIQQKNSE